MASSVARAIGPARLERRSAQPRVRWTSRAAASVRGAAAPPELVTIPYERLADVEGGELDALIAAAYGPHGLGVLTVSHVPGFSAARQELLELGPVLAGLPEDRLAAYEDPLSRYAFGWSFGKEVLQDGVADTLKGSFYANPLHDRPTEGQPGAQALLQRLPGLCRPNIWPTEDVPELREKFRHLGRMMADAGDLLFQHCDKYVFKSWNSEYNPERLTAVLRRSRCPKARLLHYFPPSAARRPPESPDGPVWCAWHTDHGSLTALTSAMLSGLDPGAAFDPRAGLYVRTARGDSVQVRVPSDHVAFQLGESAQVHSGGVLRATPHFVRACSGGGGGVSRTTFAVFLQPNWDEPMDSPPGATESDVCVGRWRPGIDFGTFTEETFAGYY
ncbi:unnamed protein product [Pedinophyceae sp. YPF-701]|nr:unnamed protein product [Pedinophyceae sp. YPF-701]